MKKIFIIILGLCGIVLIQNCSGSKKIPAIKVTAISFKKDILPIMQLSCTPCHFPPEGRKQALNTYDDVKSNINAIIARVKLPQSDERFMPFKNKKPALSDSLINVFEQWQKQNMSQ